MLKMPYILSKLKVTANSNNDHLPWLGKKCIQDLHVMDHNVTILR